MIDSLIIAAQTVVEHADHIGTEGAEEVQAWLESWIDWAGRMTQKPFISFLIGNGTGGILAAHGSKKVRGLYGKGYDKAKHLIPHKNNEN